MHVVKFFLSLTFFLAAFSLAAQKDSDVLFTVDDQEVTVGEFRYIYGKTSSDKANYQEESVKEYLDLYERFKLKVARAKSMGLDTVKALQRELEGYRRQLADNYLVGKQVTNRLVEQLYDRRKTDIEFSHILLTFKEGTPSPADTLFLYNRAMTAKKSLTAANFAETAKNISDDNFSTSRGGRIGYYNAPFPKGMHRLEAALYNAAPNEVVGPIGTSLGYHLAIKTNTRPARGEMEVGHILVRKPEGTDKMPVPVQLQSAQNMLANGTDWSVVAAKISEDSKTKDNGGYLGYFGINKFEPAFEDAAFTLTKDGQVSDIIETSAGFHLIRRISHKSVQPLNDSRPLLEAKVKADGRFDEAKKQMLQEIRKKADVKENKAVFGRYAATLADSTFLDFRWKPDPNAEKTPLLVIGNGYQVGLEQFQESLRKDSRKRVSMGRQSDAATVATTLYDEWIDKQLMAYAESRLEADFPEFAALMREYREGILLFEATKIEVWDRASEDTTGLKAFFANHRDDYEWEERATVTHYAINAKSGLNVAEVLSFAKENGMDATLDKFGRANINATTDVYEMGRLAEIGGLEAKVGSSTAVIKDARKSVSTFDKVEALLPARKKELNEARGYVIADYQDQLEREWVQLLRKRYSVQINKKVLSKLIKS
ncbi:MAG: peptidyl-prolyl cis-trans isomerase SurA [Neolewinella sp.]|jgi:peptidyl-prolyl cis-trans isomerase SurA